MPGTESALPAKRPRIGARDVLLILAFVIGGAYVSAPQLWAPWVYFTGGSFHLLPWWSAAGTFQAPDGTYQVYFFLRPLYTGPTPTRTTPLQGDGTLCTPAGKVLPLHVEGDMNKHLSRNTLGEPIEITSFVRSPMGFGGMKAAGSPHVHLFGVWALGRIETRGTLEHEPPAPGQPAPPPPAPITLTLLHAGDWSSPPCRQHR